MLNKKRARFFAITLFVSCFTFCSQEKKRQKTWLNLKLSKGEKRDVMERMMTPVYVLVAKNKTLRIFDPSNPKGPIIKES